MNTKTILKVMPYVLGALILILVGIIIYTQLKNDLDQMGSDNTQITKSATTDKNKNETKKAEGKTDTKNSSNLTDEAVSGNKNSSSNGNNSGSTITIGDQPAQTPTPVPDQKTDSTAAASSETKPTATPRPTATPIPEDTTEQLILDYVCTPKNDHIRTKNGVNLRLGPSTSTPVVAFLEWGIDIERTGYADDWTRLVYNGQECYLYTPLVLYVVEEQAAADAENAETVTGETEETTETVSGLETGADASEGGASETTGTDETVDTPPAEEDVGDEVLGEQTDDDIDIPDAEDETTGEFDDDVEAPDEGEEGLYGEGEDEEIDWDEEEEFEDADNDRSNYLIAIDPAHQSSANHDKEPLGPDSSELKDKVSAGATGVTTGTPEYEFNLELAKRLASELESRGYNVMLTRETNDVDISNVERATMANEAGADISIHIHANSASDSTVNGAETVCMTADNPYNADRHDESRYLSDSILGAVIRSTGANRRYVTERDDMSSINWSEIPTTILYVGFMSNPQEDVKLDSDDYKQDIVAGIADGIDAYFGL